MASQKISIIKVAGASGKRLIQEFFRFAKKGIIDANEYGGVQIASKAHQKQIQAIIKTLRQNNSQPPILFYGEYIDFWSCGGVISTVFPVEHSHFLQAWFNSTEIYVYTLPDKNQLLNNLKKCSASRSELIPQETRWFWTIMRLAVQAWEPAFSEATLIVIRDILGGLIEDEEIENSLTAVPEWLQKVSRR